MSAIAWDDAAFSTVIVRERGRSSIPETSVVETTGRGVLDAPHARGMTAVCEASVIASASAAIQPHRESKTGLLRRNGSSQ